MERGRLIWSRLTGIITAIFRKKPYFMYKDYWYLWISGNKWNNELDSRKETESSFLFLQVLNPSLPVLLLAPTPFASIWNLEEDDNFLDGWFPMALGFGEDFPLGRERIASLIWMFDSTPKTPLTLDMQNIQVAREAEMINRKEEENLEKRLSQN